MPTIYRSMLMENGKPRVGPDGKSLGVRVPSTVVKSKPDVIPDEKGKVSPGNGGMSVAPNWRQLPSHLIPRRLRHIAKDAAGNNQLRVWRRGEGEFTDGEITEILTLRVDSLTHGLVEPAKEMLTEEYQKALAETQPDWTIDED